MCIYPGVGLDLDPRGLHKDKNMNKIMKQTLFYACMFMAWKMKASFKRLEIKRGGDAYAIQRQQKIVVGYSFIRKYGLSKVLTTLAHEIGHLAQDAKETEYALYLYEERINPMPLIEVERDAWNKARLAFGRCFWWDEEFAQFSLSLYTKHSSRNKDY